LAAPDSVDGCSTPTVGASKDTEGGGGTKLADGEGGDYGDGGCSIAGAASLDPVFFLLIGFALLPLARQRKQ